MTQPSRPGATASVALVGSVLEGCRGVVGGSAYLASVLGAEQITTQFEQSWHDIDVFTFNTNGSELNFAIVVTKLLAAGWELKGNEAKKWSRYLDYGVGNWQTISVKLVNDQDIEVNVIHKRVNGQWITGPQDMVFSFDFAFLGVAMSLVDLKHWDFRPVIGSEGMIGYRLRDFLLGQMSEHVMLRQAQRLARYWLYGIQDELARQQLITSYRAYAAYQWQRGDKKHDSLASIAHLQSDLMEQGRWQELHDKMLALQTLDDYDLMIDALI